VRTPISAGCTPGSASTALNDGRGVEEAKTRPAFCFGLVSPASAAGAVLQIVEGSRLKTLEAMALARPVVSTTIGAEGLEAEPGRHLLVADGAEAFAAAVVRLLLSQQLRRPSPAPPGNLWKHATTGT
jgi:glycosyltransferase involved in cell wall biosynthesis